MFLLLGSLVTFADGLGVFVDCNFNPSFGSGDGCCSKSEQEPRYFDHRMYHVMSWLMDSCFGISRLASSSRIPAPSVGHAARCSMLASHDRTGNAQVQPVSLYILLHRSTVLERNCRVSPTDYITALRKILFLENPEAYFKVDNWPPESERG